MKRENLMTRRGFQSTIEINVKTIWLVSLDFTIKRAWNTQICIIDVSFPIYFPLYFSEPFVLVEKDKFHM